MKRTRALLSLMPIALVATLLTACSNGEQQADEPTDEGTATATECLPEGEATRTLEISGEFGGSVALVSGAPISVESLERSVLIDGSGRELAIGDAVSAQLTILDGVTGEVLMEQPTPFTLSEEELYPWAFGAANCASIGDRVVVAAPAEEFNSEDPEASDTLIAVLDVIGVQPGTLEDSELLSRAEGEAQQLPEGLPTVVLDAEGAPTITMPEGVAAPTELTVATLIKGDGEEVQDGDRVYVHYRGVIWRTGEEFDSSWSRGAPAAFLTTGVIRGFQEALVGQTVGSQIISVVPAEDGGYGAATLQSQGHEADDVMVFVLDILGTVHPE